MPASSRPPRCSTRPDPHASWTGATPGVPGANAPPDARPNQPRGGNPAWPRARRVRAALSTDRGARGGRSRRGRGADPLEASREGSRRAGWLSVRRRGQRAHCPDERLGHSDGVRAGLSLETRAWTAHPDQHQPRTGTARRPSLHRAASFERPARGSAARDPGSRARREQSRGAGDDHPRQLARSAPDGDSHRGRRFRHGLLVARVSEEASDSRPEDRSFVHPRRSERRARRCHLQRHRSHGPESAPRSRRRRSGDGAASRVFENHRMRARTGLLFAEPLPPPECVLLFGNAAGPRELEPVGSRANGSSAAEDA